VEGITRAVMEIKVAMATRAVTIITEVIIMVTETIVAVVAVAEDGNRKQRELIMPKNGFYCY